ncbi:MAG: hypothetical protein E6Q97_15995 [Desulfurellales bacterium]|nr:MAG: hypothetical protein E6Q97_15995 [Desulfurellales bacterium]
MINPPAILKEFLDDQSAITALTSTRIQGERRWPLPGYKPSDGPLLLFQQQPGNLDYSSKHLMVYFRFRCYGANELTANTLYGVLVDTLQDATSDPMYKAVLALPGMTQRDPDAPNDWAFVSCVFRCHFRMS